MPAGCAAVAVALVAKFKRIRADAALAEQNLVARLCFCFRPAARSHNVEPSARDQVARQNLLRDAVDNCFLHEPCAAFGNAEAEKAFWRLDLPRGHNKRLAEGREKRIHFGDD
ncbi:hypothetical protein SDC9_71968 [bioreactor metagenome]|uniref:Uncharacterized protein n=1 Tax=bioreactor metagenome TaxID=1076179 RepID=A0A644YH87_9ZZZZ